MENNSCVPIIPQSLSPVHVEKPQEQFSPCLEPFGPVVVKRLFWKTSIRPDSTCIINCSVFKQQTPTFCLSGMKTFSHTGPFQIRQDTPKSLYYNSPIPKNVTRRTGPWQNCPTLNKDLVMSRKILTLETQNLCFYVS